MAGAPIGNKNAAKAREWSDAIKWQLDNLELPESGIARGQALRAIAKTVVLQALDGNKDAWQEIGNRLEGKPTQGVAIGGDGEGGAIKHALEVLFREPG